MHQLVAWLKFDWVARADRAWLTDAKLAVAARDQLPAVEQRGRVQKLLVQRAGAGLHGQSHPRRVVRIGHRQAQIVVRQRPQADRAVWIPWWLRRPGRKIGPHLARREVVGLD